MLNPVLVQGIGLAALLIAVSVFQTNNRKTMLILIMSACVLWSAHFLLLGAITGAAMNAFAVFRSYAYYRIKPSSKNSWVLWASLGSVILITALTWQGLISLLPLMGLVSGSVAYWQKKPKNIRRFALASSPPWFVYNLISGSIPGMIVEVIMIVSNLIGQYRFDKPTFYRKLLRLKTT